jgi:hypothetical protein
MRRRGSAGVWVLSRRRRRRTHTAKRRTHAHNSSVHSTHSTPIAQTRCNAHTSRSPRSEGVGGHSHNAVHALSHTANIAHISSSVVHIAPSHPPSPLATFSSCIPTTNYVCVCLLSICISFSFSQPIDTMTCCWCGCGVRVFVCVCACGDVVAFVAVSLSFAPLPVSPTSSLTPPHNRSTRTLSEDLFSFVLFCFSLSLSLSLSVFSFFSSFLPICT